jgi:acetate CoA/acetoacetate CoA-transferase beta subunit
MQQIETPEKLRIAKKVASLCKAGQVVNLGIGIPSMAGNYTPEGVVFHSENGLMGYRASTKEERDFEWVGAGANYITPLPGAVAFDSAMSFSMVRSGCIDICVLGALQVDEEGTIANWARPGHFFGMGGAMDLVNGAKTIIVAMLHTAGKEIKIVKKCTYPITALKVVKKIITELCVIDYTDKGMVLSELAEGVTVDEVLAKTEAELIVPDYIGVY